MRRNLELVFPSDFGIVQKVNGVLKASDWITDLKRSLSNRQEKPRMIIIDTLNRSSGDASENNASGMAKIQEVLKDVAETFRSSILLLHHTVKGTGDSDAGLHQDAARGSGAGTANCRWQTNMVLNERTDQLDHMGGQQLDTISYAVSKANYGQKPATKVLVRLTNGMLLGLSAFREWNLVAPGDGQACADNENAAPNDNDRASCPSLTIHQVTPTAPSIERARRSGTTVHSI